MTEPTLARAEIWGRRWQTLRRRARAARPFAAGMLAVLAGLLAYNRLVPAPLPLTQAQVSDTVAQAMASATFELKFADGSQRPISIRVLPTKYFLKGGLYGGLAGWFHGDDRGKLYFEHEVWDLNDPATRQRVRTLADQVIEVRDGDEVGYGIIEYGVGKGFAQYASVQAHPPI